MSVPGYPAQRVHQRVRATRGLAPLAITLVILLAAVAGLHNALLEIHTSWSGKYGHFAHGYMVLAFSVWLGIDAWKRRGQLLLAPEWKALPVLLVLIGMMVIAARLQITTATQSLVPAIIISAFAVVFGFGLVRVLWWAALCVYFAMPVWWIINTPLQLLTGAVCKLLVMLTGIPAIVEGSYFQLPSGILEVALGCSGLNYLISALSLAYLYAMLYLRTWPSRLKLLLVATVAALIMNWIRVFSLICIAYATDMRHYLIQVDHLYFGWALFLLALWPIFWFASRLDRQEAQRGIPEPSVATAMPDVHIELRKVLVGGAVAAVGLLLPLLA